MEEINIIFSENRHGSKIFVIGGTQFTDVESKVTSMSRAAAG
jgi:hypothetical protein